MWVYVFDDSDEQIPPAYLAKTPIPLRALATGREIRGEAVRKIKLLEGELLLKADTYIYIYYPVFCQVIMF